MTKSNQEPGTLKPDAATPKQLTYIYNAYLKAGLTDTSRLTEIANSFIHPDYHVKHWMDISHVIASHWIDAIRRAQTIQARKRQAQQFDQNRYDS